MKPTGRRAHASLPRKFFENLPSSARALATPGRWKAVPRLSLATSCQMVLYFPHVQKVGTLVCFGIGNLLMRAKNGHSRERINLKEVRKRDQGPPWVLVLKKLYFLARKLGAMTHRNPITIVWQSWMKLPLRFGKRLTNWQASSSLSIMLSFPFFPLLKRYFKIGASIRF